VDEAEVEHLIGLVEDQDLDGRERERAAFDQVDQPAGRRHEHMGAAGRLPYVAVDRHAAEGGGDRDRLGPGIGAEGRGDLRGELARRREDEHAGAAPGRRGRPADEAVEDRQREGRRLAGAGLGDAEEVASREDEGDRLRLDRRGRGVAARGGRAGDGGREAEAGEVGHDVSCLACAPSGGAGAGWKIDGPRDEDVMEARPGDSGGRSARRSRSPVGAEAAPAMPAYAPAFGPCQ
jgi:hypothetical protein